MGRGEVKRERDGSTEIAREKIAGKQRERDDWFLMLSQSRRLC